MTGPPMKWFRFFAVTIAVSLVGLELVLLLLRHQPALSAAPPVAAVARELYMLDRHMSEGCSEYEALGGIAQTNKIFLAGNGYESDANFPGIFFQTSFIIDPSGTVVLRYRRLNSMYSPTPHDVWDSYLDIYDLEAVFPVADTAIGRLAAVASEEILYPELSRCMAMRGAEVIVHSTCEVASPKLAPKGIARRARAIKNLVYVISCNTASMTGLDLPGESADGGSMVINYLGHVLAEDDII